jgi:hypothetical protein
LQKKQVLSVLQTNGSGVLSFAGVSASAGQVIQVVSGFDITERSTTSTSFVTASNTISATITPSSASNKIFISVAFTSDDAYAGIYTIYRGATNLGDSSWGITRCNLGQQYANSGGIVSKIMQYYDSPSSTSALTYQLYCKNNGGNQGINLNANGGRGTITLWEIKG